MRVSPGSVLYTGGRLRTPFRLLIAGTLLLSLGVSVGVVGLAVGIAVDPSAAAGPALAGALGLLVLNGIALSVGAVLAARYVDRRLLADLGVAFDGAWWRDLLAGGAIGSALVASAYLAGVGTGVYEATVSPAAPAGYSLPAWLAMLAAAMVAIGVYEELLLRGYLLTNLAEGFTAVVGERTAVLAALVVSSLGFGLLHGRNPNATALSVLTIAFAGLLLGLGYVLTGRLALPIGVHVTWNLTHALLGMPVSGLAFGIRLLETATAGPALLHGGAFGIEGGLLGVGATFLGCLLVVGYARATGRGLRADVAVPALRD